MKAKLLVVALVAIGAAMSGCKKEKEEKIEIHVHSPEKGGSYSSPVPVEIHIEGGELTIHDIEVKIFEKADPNNVVFDYDNHVEVTSFEIDESFSVGSVPTSTFTLQVQVGEGDHKASYTGDFTILP